MRKAPYRWRHARVQELQAYLKAQVADGTYTPLLSQGLDTI